MKIQIVLEKAKFAKEKVVAYHATSKSNLRSIIKNGLIMNHSDGGFGSGETDDDFEYGFEPHEGVYFTTNLQTAKEYALSIDYHNPLIIVAEIQRKSTHLDEDELFKVLDNVGRRVIEEIDNLLDQYGNEYDDDMEEEVDVAVTNIIITTIRNTRHRLENFYELSPTTVNNIMHQAEPHIRRLVENLVTGRLEGNTYIRHEQDNLRKLFKNIVRNNIGDNEKSSERFSVPYNVGFKGANKIVGIIDIKNNVGWGKVHTPKMVSTPIELLN